MIPEDGHIGSAEGVILIYACLAAKLFLQYPAFLITAGGPAGWQVALIMTAAALLLFFPAAALAQRFPGHGLSDISRQVAGPFVGTALTLLVCLWVLAAITLTLRSVTENFIIAMLPHTPPSILTAAMILCMIYASYCGFESLARTTRILFPVMIVGLLIVLLFNLTRLEVGRLFPFWGTGVPTIAVSGLRYAGMAAEAVVLLLVGASFRTSSALRTSGMLGILLFGLTSAAMTASLIGVFGAPDAAQQPFPVFTLARLVYLGRFLQRTEALLVMFWFFAAAVHLSLLFHATALSLASSLRLPFYRPLIFPLAVLVASLVLLPQDYMVVVRTDRDWMRPLGIGVFLIPLLLLVVAVIRRKGGTTNAS